MLPRPEDHHQQQQQQQPQEQQEQQQQLLALLNASSRPWASLWPPSSSAGPAGSPWALSPAAAGSVGGGRGGAAEAGPSLGLGPRAATWVSPWDVALCATGTAAACENALVLAALAGAAGGPRAPASLLLGSLALADLLAGLGLLANFAVRYLVPPPAGETAALGAAGLLLTAFSASLGSLLAVTLDRYLSLRRALTYPAERARRRAAALLALLWLACLALGLLPLLGWNCLRRPPAACSVLRPVTRAQAALLAAAALLAFALTLHLDLRICRIARRHARQIALQRRLPAPAAAAAAPLATLALLLGPLALCCLPLALYALLADATYPPAYARALALPAAAHPLLNPLLYAARAPELQRTLGLLACCARARARARARPSSDV